MTASLRRCGADETWGAHDQRAGIICRFNLRLRNHCKFSVVYNDRQSHSPWLWDELSRAVLAKRTQGGASCALYPGQTNPSRRSNNSPDSATSDTRVLSRGGSWYSRVGRPGLRKRNPIHWAPGAVHLHAHIPAEY